MSLSIIQRIKVSLIWKPVLLVQKMVDECQDQRWCHFSVHSRVFGPDPCPGTRKYLVVSYKCRPGEWAQGVNETLLPAYVSANDLLEGLEKVTWGGGMTSSSIPWSAWKLPSWKVTRPNSVSYSASLLEAFGLADRRNRAFYLVAPCLWNWVITHVSLAPSLQTFNWGPMTCLFHSLQLGWIANSHCAGMHPRGASLVDLGTLHHPTAPPRGREW